MPEQNPPANEFDVRQIHRGDGLNRLSLGSEAYAPLKTFLRRHAIAFHEANIAKTYVAVSSGNVCGYITILCSQIQVNETQRPDDADGASHYDDFPALKIARLAVDRRSRGQDLGRRLMDEALLIALDDVMPVVGCRFLVVDAKADSVGFYEHYGFERIHSEEPEPESPVMLLDLQPSAGVAETSDAETE